MKNLINESLSRFGVRIVRVKSLEPENHREENFFDAHHISYCLGKNGIVTTVDMNKGRGLPLFSFAHPSVHPFVTAAKAVLTKCEDPVNTVKTILKNYYDLVTPSCPNAILGLNSGRSELKDFPAWAVLMPWDKENAIEWKEKIKSSVYSENNRYGKRLGVEDGWAWAGPSSVIKVEIESTRLLSVLYSIQKNGYNRNNKPDGDIMVNVLAKSAHDWVWQTVGAQHRAAAMAALGYGTVPVRIMRVIRRGDVLSWPNVVRGLYSKSEALKIFDDIYFANYMHVTSDWDKWLSRFTVS